MGHDRLLVFNDIVRGEFHGSIVYRGRERVEGRGDIKSRLKCLAAWLSKHRLIVAEYSPDHFERVMRILSSFFLDDPPQEEKLTRSLELRREVVKALADVRMSHRLRLLEKLVQNRAGASGRKLKLAHVLTILVYVLEQEGQDLTRQHPRSLRKFCASVASRWRTRTCNACPGAAGPRACVRSARCWASTISSVFCWTIARAKVRFRPLPRLWGRPRFDAPSGPR
ncbi:hypothetical protein DFAR_360009 [Desulfarculales bacterium]